MESLQGACGQLKLACGELSESFRGICGEPTVGGPVFQRLADARAGTGV